MKLWWLAVVLVLCGCRTRYYDLRYNQLRVGILETEEQYIDGSYYRIESTDGVTLKWFPEIPVLDKFLYW